MLGPQMQTAQCIIFYPAFLYTQIQRRDFIREGWRRSGGRGIVERGAPGVDIEHGKFTDDAQSRCIGQLRGRGTEPHFAARQRRFSRAAIKLQRCMQSRVVTDQRERMSFADERCIESENACVVFGLAQGRRQTNRDAVQRRLNVQCRRHIFLRGEIQAH